MFPNQKIRVVGQRLDQRNQLGGSGIGSASRLRQAQPIGLRQRFGIMGMKHALHLLPPPVNLPVNQAVSGRRPFTPVKNGRRRRREIAPDQLDKMGLLQRPQEGLGCRDQTSLLGPNTQIAVGTGFVRWSAAQFVEQPAPADQIRQTGIQRRAPLHRNRLKREPVLIHGEATCRWLQGIARSPSASEQ